MTTGLPAVEKVPVPRSVHPSREKGPHSLWLLIGILLASLEWYTKRYGMGVDGVGYIDTALAYARGDWHIAVNTYWSPLYSWIIAACLRVVPTNVRTELPLVHAVNVLCFAFALWAFHRFWRLLKDAHAPDEESATVATLTPQLYDAFGYSLFFYLFLPLIGAITPDTLSAAFVFLLAYELLRWRRTGLCSVSRATGIGALIAIAFFAKAILLYFGAIALLCTLFDSSLHRRIRTASIAAIVTLTLIAPWAVALRWSTGEWSLGSSGKLNYAWFVDGAPTGIFQDPDGPPSAFFPGERIQPDMKAFIVPTVEHVTYMPWYDPGRMDHRKPHLVLRGQALAIIKNLLWLRIWFLIEFAGIVFTLTALALISGRRWISALSNYRSILVPSIALFGMYTLIFVRSYRYVAATTLLLFGIALISAVPKIDARRYVASIMIAGLLLFWMTNVPGTLKGSFQSSTEGLNSVRAAESLIRILPPDTKVAVVGEGAGAYWAHLARLQIVGEIWKPDDIAYWTLPCVERQQILSRMHAAGARAVIATMPERYHAERWQSLGDSTLSMLTLSEPPDLNCEFGRP
jgi:hypothetical protein